MPRNQLSVAGSPVEGDQDVLTGEALEFLAALEERFSEPRAEVLAARMRRRAAFRAGELPDFLAETHAVREGSWQVASAPADLLDRRVEITGPVERKMMINALNSGAQVFLADFEDALSPTWENVIGGQRNCQEAVRGRISYTSPEGKQYALGPRPATLVMRPRGWHLNEKHLQLNGSPVSASLVDFGLHFFHNAAEPMRRRSGPYFYLPKLESHRE
jgi:malate synthase